MIDQSSLVFHLAVHVTYLSTKSVLLLKERKSLKFVSGLSLNLARLAIGSAFEKKNCIEMGIFRSNIGER